MISSLRLYRYEHGRLVKEGRFKTKGLWQHYFTEIIDVDNHILELPIRRKKNKQFVLIEYFSNFSSKIIKIYEC